MNLHVETEGDGPDLVMLHGWGLHGGIFDALTRRLDDDLRVHRIDLPGHGQSLAGPVGLINWVDSVAEVMPERATVLGWSLGGLVAQGLALRHPQRVAGLVLVGTSARLTRSKDWPWGVSIATLNGIGNSLRQDYLATLQEFLMLQMLGQPKSAALLRTLRNAMVDCPPKPEGLYHGLDILRETDLVGRLPEMAMPSLLIAGERDRLAHPDAMARMMDAMPQSELWRVTCAAHAPFLSHESGFAQRVIDFVNTCD